MHLECVCNSSYSVKEFENLAVFTRLSQFHHQCHNIFKRHTLHLLPVSKSTAILSFNHHFKVYTFGLVSLEMWIVSVPLSQTAQWDFRLLFDRNMFFSKQEAHVLCRWHPLLDSTYFHFVPRSILSQRLKARCHWQVTNNKCVACILFCSVLFCVYTVQTRLDSFWPVSSDFVLQMENLFLR